ncbi:MAG TPA: ATP-binding protein [Dehalococcoidia bacterium]|nr:ATP-binding protein [Dehalococcoidia bacterium]
MPDRLRQWPAGCTAGTLALALTVLILRPLRLDLGLTNIALLLLLLTVMTAAAWGWIAGIYMSIASNIAFNFFFVPPLYRFTVQQPDNALALALFLLVAAITASLLARARRSALEAERRASDTRTLLALSRATRDRPLEELPASICDWIIRDFGVRACALYRLEGEELIPVASAGESVPSLNRGDRTVALQAAQSGRPTGLGYRLSRIGRRGADPMARGLLYLPLGVEGTPVGVLRIHTRGAPLSDDRERLLEAFADEAAAAIQRGSLAASAQTAALLQETDRLRSSLLSSVSHDLRTPLTSIKTSVANLMSREVKWSDTAREEFLSAIDHEADRLTRLVTNLLDLSRIEAGVLRLDLDWNDLDELLRNAIYRTEQSMPDRPIRLELDAVLPLLRFDYVQVDRVVANLLDNAVKYSPPASPIDVRVRIEPERVTIGIHDRGSGIPARDRARVFDAFYRSERRDRSTGGSGLGLAICRGVVEAHGGKIWAASGDGAALLFTLPREPLPAALPDQAKTDMDAAATPEALRTR